MLNQDQFKTLQQKRETASGADYWLQDALIFLDLDMPEVALESLKIALEKTATEMELN